MKSNNNGEIKPTLLSSLEQLQTADSFSRDAVHPFAANTPKTCNFLQDLISATEQISTSLRLYDASAQWTNPKLVSLLRQHTAIEHTSFTIEKGMQHLVESLQARSGVNYSESLPLNAGDVPHWCIQQLVAWGTLVGMEAFQGDENQSGSTVVMGGKVLVLDVDFAIHRDNNLIPKLEVVNVKTANALLAGNSNSNSGSSSSSSSGSGTSALLDSFLLDGIREYCVEMQKDEELRDSQRASALRRRMVEHLKYLVLLDGLASHKDGGGIRWFTDVDEFYPSLMELARSEAQAVAASLSSPIAPLDVFLLRGHSLPLPYLMIPSISFLVHLSASAYLHLIRNSTNQKQPVSPLPLDITQADLKKWVTGIPEGVTIATLYLQERSGSGVHHLYPGSISMPDVTARPSFPLSPSSSQFDHVFPQINISGVSINPSQVPYTWILDFTQGGKRRGIVMSQSRMKAIELVVNPLASRNNLNGLGDVVAGGSWVGLLLNTVPTERYTALYKSPNSLHPPLQLRLVAPEEPGYILDRVPIHRMKEIWGILEIVREQCWLNETLLDCEWISETLRTNEEEELFDTVPVNEEGLQAVLTGTFAARKIPVNVFIPSWNETEELFGEFSTGSRPRIVMTCPERAPISGHVEITIRYDEKKARGVSVTVDGAVGLDINSSKLEEVCRRGGTWGLAGRILSNE